MSEPPKPKFVGWCARDILAATELMDPLEELAYRRVIDWIYASNDRLRDDDRILARITKAGRRWKAIKARLVSAGKLEVANGFISNLRARYQLDKARDMSSQKSHAASARWLKKKETANAGADTAAYAKDKDKDKYIPPIVPPCDDLEGLKTIDSVVRASPALASLASKPINGHHLADPLIRKQRWEQKICTELIRLHGPEAGMTIIDAYQRGEPDGKRAFEAVNAALKASKGG